MSKKITIKISATEGVSTLALTAFLSLQLRKLNILPTLLSPEETKIVALCADDYTVNQAVYEQAVAEGDAGVEFVLWDDGSDPPPATLEAEVSP